MEDRTRESSLCDLRVLLFCLGSAVAVTGGASLTEWIASFNEPVHSGISYLVQRYEITPPACGSHIGSSASDAALAEQVRRGDSRAFEALVRRHLRAAHGMAVSIVGTTADADDVCQDAFLSALMKIDQCRDPAKFRAWLLSIVRNRALGMRSYEAVRKATPLEGVRSVTDGDDPSWAVERRELREDLAAALESLTEYQRRVVVLYDLEGWSHKEIAEELGISPGSSRVHLHVARRNLRSRLGSRHLRWA
jgi:RNA polymerase sigma-70 factor (ECF subfamily)